MKSSHLCRDVPRQSHPAAPPRAFQWKADEQRTLAARGLPAVLGDCRRRLLARNFSRFGMAPPMVFSLRIFSAGTHPGLLLICLGSEREHRFVQVKIHSPL